MEVTRSRDMFDTLGLNERHASRNQRITGDPLGLPPTTPTASFESHSDRLSYVCPLNRPGFGTAAAGAKALGLKDDNKKLSAATKEIYGGDEFMTKLAETSVNLQAEDA